MFDFDIFWKGWQAVLHGQSPYTVALFYSTPAFAVLLSPLGLLPEIPAFIVWTVMQLTALVVTAKRAALRLVVYLPVTFAVWMGQADILILLAGWKGGWVGLALATLKPQLALWLLPWKFYEWHQQGRRADIWKCLGLAAVLNVLPVALWPDLLSGFLQAGPSLWSYSEHASSLFGLAAWLPLPVPVSFGLVALLGGIVWWALKPYPRDYWSFVALFNPVSNVYSLSVLMQSVDWIAVALSWLLLPVALWTYSGAPWALVPVYLMARSRRNNHT